MLVVDGPVSDDINNIINKYKEETGIFNVIYLEKNTGHGNARSISLNNCKYDLVAIMDSDDISIPTRFEQQIKAFENNNYDVVGGDISEFIDDEVNIISKRCVPKTDKEIKKFLKVRCPLNNVTVMFKKDSVQKVGGYLDWYCNEDYYLWIRMYLANAIMANTGTILVNVRIGKDMYKRRGGDEYYQSEIGIQKLMLEKSIIDKKTYTLNCIKRWIVEKALPSNLRGLVYKFFARN